MNVGRFLERLRGMTVVGRWNFHSRLTTESVGEHSFYVTLYALLIVELSDGLTPEDRASLEKRVLLHALFHDVEEAVTGDLPMLVKREIKTTWERVAEHGLDQILTYLPAFTAARFKSYAMETSDTVHKVVKAADFLDALMYSRHEKSLGNKTFDVIEMELVTLLYDMGLEAVNKHILPSLGYKENPRAQMVQDMSHM